MKDTPQPDKVSLGTLISRIRDGYYVIPDFQREFEWEPADIRELMSSIFRDYYIGSLLLWRGTTETFSLLACEPLKGYADGLKGAQSIVLDGQQRLSAMFYAFMAPDMPAPRRKSRYLYFIDVNQFVDEQFDDAFRHEWTQRGTNLLRDPNLQFENHLFPLATLGSQKVFAVSDWFSGYKSYWEKRRDEPEATPDSPAPAAIDQYLVNAETFGERITESVQDYQISYIELDREMGIDKVCDTFTRINSRGVRLDIFDLLNAMLRPRGITLKEMWRSAEPGLAWADSERMNVYVLQVMSMLGQAYCSPRYLYYLLPGQRRKIKEPDGSTGESVLVPDEADFLKRWDQAVAALTRGLGLLRDPQDYGALLPRFLPYISIIPAFAALQQVAASTHSDLRLAAASKIKSWYWASVFTRRYSGSVESTAARDFLDVSGWITGDGPRPPVLGEFSSVLPNIDLHTETRLASSIYRGVLNLIVLHGARDWLTGNAPKVPDLDDHHIIPQSWGRTQKMGDRINTVLNRTILSAESNREIIGDKLPAEYLPKWVETASEAKVLSILETHYISEVAYRILLRNPFGVDDFEEFIKERDATIMEAIGELATGE